MTSSSSPRRGLLLLNLGTPESPQPHHVRTYLKEFLMDPFVVDIPYPLRWLLVHGAILPRRPVASGKAYEKIWTERGSPLLYHLLDLTEKVGKSLDESWMVLPGMRYGNPSLEKAFLEFKNAKVQDMTVLPLYPQYSLSASESSIVECKRLAANLMPDIKLRFIPPFYKDPLFIEAFAKVTRESLSDFQYDHLLLSFHGLPERQIKKTDSTGKHCLASQECCNQLSPPNALCYRAHCFETARLMTQKLGLAPDRYTVAFQSRLGRTPWIKPFSDELYRTLPQQGVKRLAVACPAFVADCLETLEEVQLRGKEEFVRHGGVDLKLVPSLNSNEVWVRAVAEFARAK